MEIHEFLKTKITEVPDFPTPGVSFKDIAPLIEDADAFRQAVDGLVKFFQDAGMKKIVGVDARGFLLASAVAYALGTGVVMARKKGKLPRETVAQIHALEYGRGWLEMHKDSIQPGEPIAIIDDVLATGGTAHAAVRLVEQLAGTIVGIGFLVELSELGGRKRLEPYLIHSLIVY